MLRWYRTRRKECHSFTLSISSVLFNIYISFDELRSDVIASRLDSALMQFVWYCLTRFVLHLVWNWKFDGIDQQNISQFFNLITSKLYFMHDQIGVMRALSFVMIMVSIFYSTLSRNLIKSKRTNVWCLKPEEKTYLWIVIQWLKNYNMILLTAIS